MNLGSIIGDSIIMHAETVNTADGASTKVSTNVTSTVPRNYFNKIILSKIHNGLLYSAHGFISGYITIYNCHYLLSLSKT